TVTVRAPRSTLFPYTTLFRSGCGTAEPCCRSAGTTGRDGNPSWPEKTGRRRISHVRSDFLPSTQKGGRGREEAPVPPGSLVGRRDRKSTRLNSSHVKISYAVF